ncbi:MAG: DUF456 domain-containing protein [Planctomycetes bacterium]|nr:DUF456 domain-containing protein [Planctomycetota bacterium]MBL7009082.1 DUF456 domain-containing protein [Planctomycetota bacterium]
MLESTLLLAGKTLLCLVSLGSLALIPFGLPGNVVVALLALLGPVLGMPWQDFWIIAGAALVAEAVEFLASLGLAKKTGASRIGLWGAFFGGIVGAVALTPLVPPFGTLLGGAAGSFAGAALFEFQIAQRRSGESVRVGLGAFFGALIGRMLKIWLGLLQVAWLVLALWF